MSAWCAICGGTEPCPASSPHEGWSAFAAASSSHMAMGFREASDWAIDVEAGASVAAAASTHGANQLLPVRVMGLSSPIRRTLPLSPVSTGDSHPPTRDSLVLHVFRRISAGSYVV